MIHRMWNQIGDLIEIDHENFFQMHNFKDASVQKNLLIKQLKNKNDRNFKEIDNFITKTIDRDVHTWAQLKALKLQEKARQMFKKT